jgi:hypothetical protein
VKGDVGMSFGLIFRSCCHVKEKSKCSGKLKEAEADVGLPERDKGKLDDFLDGRTARKDGMTKEEADK